MQNYRLALLSAVTLALSASGSQAGPCPEIAQGSAARPDLGFTAHQSVAAQMHRQPTAASVAAAQKEAAAGAPARPPGCPDSEKYGEPAEGDRGAK